MARKLLTEREIREAARGGARTLDVTGAVVTPSARDLAVVLGVELTGAPLREGRAVRGRDAGRGAPPEKQVKRAPLPAPNPSPALTTPPPPPARPPVVIGADHGGVALKTAIADHLKQAGFPVTDLGTHSREPVDYPDVAIAVARHVALKKAAIGIMIDGAGIGSCMAANKVAGVRAAMCYDVTTAANAREHNSANLLTLGGGLIGTRLALAIVDTFLATPFAGGRHAARVEKIDALDRRG